MLGRDFEDEVWLRFVFELVIWPNRLLWKDELIPRVRCAFGNVFLLGRCPCLPCTRCSLFYSSSPAVSGFSSSRKMEQNRLFKLKICRVYYYIFQVFRIHWIMAALVFLKSLSLFFHGVSHKLHSFFNNSTLSVIFRSTTPRLLPMAYTKSLGQSCTMSLIFWRWSSPCLWCIIWRKHTFRVDSSSSQ